MKITSLLVFGLLIIVSAVYSTAQTTPPQVTVLGNSIDLPLSAGYIDTLKAIGFSVETISASELPQHQSDPLILILGGPHAPEGVGAIVGQILTQREKDMVLSDPTAKIGVLIPSVWTEKQRVMVFAGYGKEQTRKAFGDAQGDLIKTLRFNDSAYIDNFTATEPVNVPPLDDTQPFTEINAYQANTLIQSTPGLMLIDVRGVPFYDAGHIPGAINIPEHKLEQTYNKLDKNKTYLINCGGNSESIAAGNFLAGQGFKKIYRLVDGYMAWRKAGFPREKSA